MEINWELVLLFLLGWAVGAKAVFFVLWLQGAPPYHAFFYTEIKWLIDRFGGGMPEEDDDDEGEWGSPDVDGWSVSVVRRTVQTDQLHETPPPSVDGPQWGPGSGERLPPWKLP